MLPFRFAVQLNKTASGPAWRDMARKVEGLGYSTLYIPDHFDDQYGPLVALTVAAEATTDLHVGSLVLGNDYRHPRRPGQGGSDARPLFRGPGRVRSGRGWMTSDYDQSGMSNDSPGTRIDRMMESLAIMKSLWTDGRATLAGQDYTVTDALGTPTPHQRPHPPVIIGGGGKRVLTFAGQEADIVGINPNLAAGYVGPEVAATTLVESYRQRVEWVRAGAGDRFDQLELQILTFFVQVVDNAAEVFEQMAPMSAPPRRWRRSPWPWWERWTRSSRRCSAAERRWGSPTSSYTRPSSMPSRRWWPSSPAPRVEHERIGVFGGTFDPIHTGHVETAEAVPPGSRLGPNAAGGGQRAVAEGGHSLVTPAEDRYAMVEAAVSGHPGLEPSRLEIERGGPSYTIDTVDELHRLDPTSELFLVVGADVVPDLPTWRNQAELAASVVLVVVDVPEPLGRSRRPNGMPSRCPCRPSTCRARSFVLAWERASRSAVWCLSRLSVAFAAEICTLRADERMDDAERERHGRGGYRARLSPRTSDLSLPPGRRRPVDGRYGQ